MYGDGGCGRKGCELCDEEVIAFLALQNPEAAAAQYGANELACDEDGNLLAMSGSGGGGGGGGGGDDGGGGRAKPRRPPNFIIAGGGSTPQMFR